MNVCRIEGCNRTCHGRGLCRMHYDRMRRHGHTEPQRPVRRVRTGFVRLPLAPLAAKLADHEAGLGPLRRNGRTDERAWLRARRRGWINDHHAEDICGLLGLTLDEVYGPDWDREVAS